MTPYHPSGLLRDWNEIADFGWRLLLLGNGMSINVSERFAYASVAKLRDGITLARIMGEKTGALHQRFRSVQAALGEAVREVHVDWVDIPDSTLEEIKQELERYDAIFSTSYDLLLYWAMVQGDDWGSFCDCFWSNDCNEFSLEDCDVWPGYVPIYYMHGALHLIVTGAGATRKLVQQERRLLEQFGDQIPEDPNARPLLISEGSARDKLRAIEGNDYLSHVYETFKEPSEPLLVFGHSLGDQDRHLIDAINANPDRPVAVSMVEASPEDLKEKQSRIWGKLHTDDVHFFDAATHPLGSPEHRSVGATSELPSG